MPQMDTITFLPQVFWLVIIFMTFYLIVLRQIAPVLSQILKLRLKKMDEGDRLCANMRKEKQGLHLFFREGFRKSGRFLIGVMDKDTKSLTSWLQPYFPSLKTDMIKNMEIFTKSLSALFQAKMVRVCSSVVEQSPFKSLVGGSIPSSPSKICMEY